MVAVLGRDRVQKVHKGSADHEDGEQQIQGNHHR